MTPEQLKNVKTGLVVLGGLGILYLVFKNRTENSGTVDPTGNGGYTPVVGVFNAHNVATNLYDTMKNMGTDEEAILEILKPINQAQFSQVVIAFGKLAYNPVTGDQRNYNPFGSLAKYDLKGWLKEELSAKDYAILRSKYPYSL